MSVTICCAAWRQYPQHGDCPGFLYPGNRTDAAPVRCECVECNHAPLVEVNVPRQRTVTR